MSQFDAGILAMRIGLGWVFLYAAWKNTENAAAWRWTKNETALLFTALSAERRDRMAALAALAGMAMMYGGGISALLGIAPRAGGLCLMVFSALGTRIHAIRRTEAKVAADSGNPMGWSAYSAHVAAGLKNWALFGAAATLVLAGAGRYAIGPDLGGSLFSGFLP